MRKRPIKISLRLNEQEHEHLKQQAMLSGFPMEVFLRALISGMNLRSRPLAEYTEIRRQLAGIGNNINQIAHVVNTRGFATKEDIAAVTTAQRVIWQIAKRLCDILLKVNIDERIKFGGVPLTFPLLFSFSACGYSVLWYNYFVEL